MYKQSCFSFQQGLHTFNIVKVFFKCNLQRQTKKKRNFKLLLGTKRFLFTFEQRSPFLRSQKEVQMRQ